MDTNLQTTESTRSNWVRQGLKYGLYWFQVVLQPVLAVAFVIGLAWAFGYMQRNHNWFDSAATDGPESVEEDAQYACSMLCVFTGAPGRCPVCGMELQKIEKTGDPKDIYGVTIAPTARRLANIETVAALNMPVSKTIVALGRVSYNETSEATVSSYVDGRIEDLMVGFTGAMIRKGDPLAVIFSPDLYADQVSLLQAKQAIQKKSKNARVNRVNRRLYESARMRLIEQGMPETQVDVLERSGKANRRTQIFAPLSGTVVEKMADEGKYVKTGTPILKIADLSSVWLMLEIYPKDLPRLRLGQSVDVEIQSQVGSPFEGKISFVDSVVNPKTQMVNVRVVIPNEAGIIKIGDLAKARIQTSEELNEQRVVVPRESVLINGSDSIAYVETEPGRFEFRKVDVAEIAGDQVSIVKGIQPGEQVVSSGAFMLDSTFNLRGKVSLIDPNRIERQQELPVLNEKEDLELKEIEASFANLLTPDRALAETQIICPVTEVKLGTMGMGAPIRIALGSRDVMICCAGCESNLRKDPEKYFAVLDEYSKSRSLDSRSESRK